MRVTPVSRNHVACQSGAFPKVLFYISSFAISSSVSYSSFTSAVPLLSHTRENERCWNDMRESVRYWQQEIEWMRYSVNFAWMHLCILMNKVFKHASVFFIKLFLFKCQEWQEERTPAAFVYGKKKSLPVISWWSQLGIGPRWFVI